MKAVVVVGHGSRSADAKETFYRVVEGLRSNLQIPVEGCFMEISEPNIKATIPKLYEEGIREILVLPYFLFKGIHISEDIPEILQNIKGNYIDLKLNIAEPIGYHDLLVELLSQRLQGESTCI